MYNGKRESLISKKELLDNLAQYILDIKLNHPIKVGIDGIAGSGKTCFANELADVIQDSGREVIIATIDDFHNPKEIRHKKGRYSAEGYYYDAFNYHAVIKYLLAQLEPNGSLQYKRAIINFPDETALDLPYKIAESNAIAIIEGVFLFRPELRKYWNLKIFIESDSNIALQRALQRDDYLGDKTKIKRIYQERYNQAQQIYFNSVHPKELADIIIDNNDFENPVVVKKIQS
ncbi:hypothetical protein HZA96_06695 [Candidatus Woesearchaeota archaeon]|nr:hypothetical protein [Candidatus Woesearchaeota archaeon]